MRRLMLATEGTPQDAGAERIALALARVLGAHLTVVLPLTTNEELLGVAPDVAIEAEASAGSTLRRLAAAAAREGVRAETVVRRGGSVAQEIVAAAAAHETELVVTRRIGRRGMLARLLVGEMVSQVAAQVARPVLMAPESAAMLWRHRVVLPQAMASAPVEAVAAVLAAAAGVAVAKPSGDPLQVVAHATPADLCVIALRRADVASGRIDVRVESAIGAAPCPAVLVPTGADVAGRA